VRTDEAGNAGDEHVQGHARTSKIGSPAVSIPILSQTGWT
jgi:hypothetical protein